MSDQRPSPSPSSRHGRGLRIAALLTFAAGLALAASPATAKRPSVTRNRGFSAEDAQVYAATNTNKKKRRGRKGKNKKKPAKSVRECDTDEDCLAEPGLGNRCNTDKHTCYTEFPDQPLKTCAQPRCRPGLPATVWPQCGVTPTRELLECLPVVGDVCGVCENGGPGAGPCHKKNERKHKQEVASCKADHSPTKTGKFAIECAINVLKCTEGDPIACAKSLPCVANPTPVREYRDCLTKEAKRYLDQGQVCTMK